MSPLRLNIGCGMTVTHGWHNYDNSLSVRLAGLPAVLRTGLTTARLISHEQAGFIAFCRTHDVRYCNAARRIPHADASVDAIYSSHMLEHLSCADAAGFLGEAYRVLKPGSVIRIAVPDLKLAVDNYLADGEADKLMEYLLVSAPPIDTVAQKLKLLAMGYRHHQWMYDGASLCKLLAEHGFKDAAIQPPGVTMIGDPGALDLHERSDVSVYVEARK